LADTVQRALGARYRLLPDPPDLPQSRPPWRLFLADDTSTGRQVAVKAVACGEDDDAGRRFDRNAGMLANVCGWRRPDGGHPRLLPILDRGHREGVVFHVTPWLPEGSLRARLARERPLGLQEAVAIFDDVGDGLGFLHSKGVIHRRIGTSNVLLDHGRAVLADGLSEMMALAYPLDLAWLPDCQSPEAVRGARAALDVPAEVYSVGLLLYRMLAGRLPWDGDTLMQHLFKRLMEPAPALTTFRPDAPPALSEVLGKAMALEPSERFATVGELREAVKAAVR
jgi:serine/threonine-protein kinase